MISKEEVMHISKYEDPSPPVDLIKETLSGGVIEVTNIPAGIMSDDLTVFFENKRKIGGGEIEQIEFNNADASAVIRFKDPTGTLQKNNI